MTNRPRNPRPRLRRNTRNWSTPMIIAASLFSATTGLLMFFYVVAPFKFAHELMGLVFTVAIILHVISNFRPFRNHLTRFVGFGVFALVLAAAIGLLVLSMNDHSVRSREAIVEAVGGATVASVIEMLDIDEQEFIDTMAANGITVDDFDQTVQQLARRYDGDAEDVLRYVLIE